MPIIVVIDDEPTVGSLLSQALEGNSFDVQSFVTAAQALAFMTGRDVDVVVVDKNLPDASGVEVLQQTKQSHPLCEVILITGYASASSALEAVELGALDYLPKPFEDLAIVEAKIKRAVERVQLKKSQEELLRRVVESEMRYALAARGSNDGLWDWDLTRNELHASSRWTEMLGLGDGDVTAPKQWFDLVHPEDLPAFQDALEEVISGGGQQLHHEYRILTGESGHRWVLVRGASIRDSNGRTVRLAGSQTDVDDRRRVEELLAYEAFHDRLTGLPNRALFTDRLQRAIDRSHRDPKRHFAVLILDVDRFKNVNDSLGHHAGDEFLVEVSQRLATLIRGIDTVARLGGDEFAILVDLMGAETDATRVADRIQADFARPFDVEGQAVYCSVSIGVAIHDPRYHRAAEIMRDADIAMNRAKGRGKATYQIFDRAMHDRAVRLLSLENELRGALGREEFCLHYQPIVSLTTGKIVGFEALLRWERSEGMMQPADFIPLAEETGLIVPIGRWVMKEAFGQLARWHQKFNGSATNLKVSVNLSGRQFSQPNLVDSVRDILNETGVDPTCVHLEITESEIMREPEYAKRMLLELKSLQTSLSMDDFGTGYSSLSYLNRFPFDVLKIDRYFVQRLGNDGYEGDIVQTILALSERLSVDVVAEGVETEDQLSALRDYQCAFGQGYLFARPLTVEHAEGLLAEMPEW